MKIAIGCDHGGIALKPAIVEELKRRGVDIVDVGCYDTSSVDYPDYGAAVARKVASGECDKGISRRQDRIARAGGEDGRHLAGYAVRRRPPRRQGRQDLGDRGRKLQINTMFSSKAPSQNDGVLTCKLFVKNRPDPLDKRRYGCIILADKGRECQQLDAATAKSRRIQK